VSTAEWIVEHMRKYLAGSAFTLYSHGSCVVWMGAELSVAEANDRLRAVTLQDPDFKVRRHIDGNFLVTFKGGVGGLLSGKLLADNYESLRRDALRFGMLPSEELVSSRHGDSEESDMIAGLYVRAQLYRDVDDLGVVAVSR